jgi:hypothetical protein
LVSQSYVNGEDLIDYETLMDSFLNIILDFKIITTKKNFTYETLKEAGWHLLREDGRCPCYYYGNSMSCYSQLSKPLLDSKQGFFLPLLVCFSTRTLPLLACHCLISEIMV